MRRGFKVVSKIRRSRETAYTSSWSDISKSVLDRDGRRCTKCGCAGSKNNPLRCHHIIPVSKGGQTVPYNLTTVCEHCHSKQPGHSHLR
jgi:5-methylcytosine-specific restriction endonuclease McrA